MAETFSTLSNFTDVLQRTRVFLNGLRTSGVDLYDGLEIAAELLRQVRENKKKVFFIGNGGSAAIASHQALDLWNHGKIRSHVFNDSSQLTCLGNDFGYENVFSKPLEVYCDPGDCLVAIGSSGASKNILTAVEVAENHGASVIGFSGFLPDNPLSQMGYVHFYVPSKVYGVVESLHFLLLHALIDEVARTAPRPGDDKKSNVLIHPRNKHTNPADSKDHGPKERGLD